uniref:protein-tyrosine-phosphatase n=1 Tax=Crassostrea virginica TaxID=6565 RepID=A0A8B8BRG4_CRAVI|nr:receptor-type tyrosine-protein phosphatase epsilon-like isoform X2 [Crassostrea virginica]
MKMKCTNLILFFVGYFAVLAYDDLSKQKIATQSTTVQGDQYKAGNAVDRDTKTCMRTKEIGQGEQIIDKTVWWKVDLGGVYNIYSVNIQFRNYDGYGSRQQGRFAGFSLYISNTGNRETSSLCYKDGPALPPLNFTTTCTLSGRYVIFYNERLNGVTYPPGYILNTNLYTELCEVTVYGCSKPGVYGSNCSIPCPNNCRYRTCHIMDGTCFGCEAGYKGTICATECPDEWYGLDCKQNCSGHCRDNDPCNKVTGRCDKGCTYGWYGQHCEHRCVGHCIYNASCNQANGICNGGCAHGWYGQRCEHRCVGHCYNNASCNQVNGTCDGGCAAGWIGSLCENECSDGAYGYNCVNKCSGHCMGESPCNKQTGYCDRGCKPGYTNASCNTECSFGTYGKHCAKNCSGYCLHNKSCNHIDGVCTDGCQNGYIGDISCEHGHYGKNCLQNCSSNCKTCKHTDGTCSCHAGWSGPNCSFACNNSYGENCQYSCDPSCVNHTCDPFDGNCQHACSNDSSKGCDVAKPESLDQGSGVISVAIGGIFSACVILVIAIAVFLIRYKRKSSIMTKKKTSALSTKQHLPMKTMKKQHYHDYDSALSDEPDEPDDSAPVLPERNMRGPPTNKNIPVRNIKAQIANMSAKENAGFKYEYNDIPRGELCSCLEGKKPENKVKNRYVTIFSYDHSRVVLNSPGYDGNGYIHANYIEDTKGVRSYIATQGPKPKTIADFWTMVSQEEVTVIVCLTNLKEGAKNKCAQYWPNVNDKLQGGNITIRNLGEKTYAEHIIRQFKIHNKAKGEDRLVTMYHYTAWADHGVADPLSLVVFHRQVMKATAQSNGKYTLVHCSAGVGRTGTYIALDALYREGQKSGKINVPMYVRTMRKDRMNMIQGDEQYKLLYLALMEAFNGPSRCLATEKFLRKYQDENCYTNCGNVRPNTTQKFALSTEFEELLALRKVYSNKDYELGQTHLSANYTQNVLPVEQYICHLSYVRGRNTYYNAVLLQSFLEKDCMISGQYPLPDYTEDLLRIIRDFDARIVVFLCPVKDLASSSTWFPTKTQVKFIGNFTIKHVNEAKGSHVKMTKLVLQAKENNDMRITVLECPTWKERQSTADKRVLLDVIKEVKTEKINTEGRILVLSSDGATRCGPFFVVYNALEQITVDREVDIFTIARQLQVRRTEFVSTLDEYQLCYDVIAEYLLNDCVYGNV